MTTSVAWEEAYRGAEQNLEDCIAKIRQFGLASSLWVLDVGCGDRIDIEAFKVLGFNSVLGRMSYSTSLSAAASGWPEGQTGCLSCLPNRRLFCNYD